MICNYKFRFDRNFASIAMFFFLFLSITWSSPVFALPTPDVLINAFQVFPLVISTLLGIMAFLGVLLKKRLSRLKNPVNSLLKGIVILFFCLILSLAFLTYKIVQIGDSNRLRNVEMYLRSDISLDQLEIAAVDEQDKWFSSGILSHLSFDALVNFRDHPEEPILIDLARTKLTHDSGFLAIPYKGKLKEFVFVYPSELKDYLKRIIDLDGNSLKRPIIFYNWDRFTIWRSFSNFAKIRKLLQKFDAVYALPRVYTYDIEKLASKNSFIKICIRNPDTGQIEETDRVKDIVNYPVRNEAIAFNEKLAAYPNLLKLIPVDNFIDILSDAEVQLVAPFNSLYRTREVYKYYIDGYFRNIDPDRIRFIDFNSPNITQNLRSLSQDLKDKKFVTIGLAKQDWIYMGVDVAHSVWKEHGRIHPSSFKYLGSTVRISEAAAVMISKESSLSKKAIRKLHKVFGALLNFISNKINVPLSFSILFISIVFRLTLFPLGYLESKSRLIRSDLRRFSKLKLENHPEFFFLKKFEDSIAKLLGCNKAFEIFGGIISLALILPFIPILSNISWENTDPSFLWIYDISQPSHLLTLLLVTTIFLKLLVSRVSLFPKGIRKTDLFLIAALVFFYVLLSKMPGSVILFAIGVIFTQTIIDIAARITTFKTVINSMTLKRPAIVSHSDNPSKDDNSGHEPVLSLQESVKIASIGNKGRRLGELLNDYSKLFIVPKGLVLTSAGLRLALSGQSEYDTQLYTKMKKIFPDLNTGKFAVRSCGFSEDNSQSSLAGKYKTILNVDCKEMRAAIHDVSNSFDENDRERSAIIVQQMADVDIAGVLFTASPENRKLSSIEYSQGLAESLVSGETTPIQVRVGNFSGTVRKSAGPSLALPFFRGKKEEIFYQRLFLVGKLIEEKFGCPQDIEWGYNCKNETLYIIQSRDITSIVDDEIVADEQSRLLAIATDTKQKTKSKHIWRYSDISEVVNKPSPFTISLLSELYANSGSQGIANRRLGFPVPKNQETIIESIFGTIFDSNRALRGNRNFLKNTISHLFLKRRIKNNPFVNFIYPITKRLDELKSTISADLIENDERMLSNVPEEIFSFLADKIDYFCREYYSIAYETTVLANLANRYLIGNNYSHGTDESLIPTKTTEMYIALSELNRSGNIDQFIEKWGHRSLNDYDLASPSFSERHKDALSYASKFAGFYATNGPPVQENCTTTSMDYALDTYHQFVIIKERAKDESLCYLRSLKKVFTHLANVLKIPQKRTFNFYLSEIRLLARHCNSQSLSKVIQESKSRHSDVEQLREIEFSDNISIENIEFLVREEFEVEDYNQDCVTPDESTKSGTMVSIPRPFDGKLKFIQSPEDYDSHIENDDILVTKHLSPDLVPLFSKASGCISEKGGRLSHAAIVAREMNFPVLVGVRINMAEFADGQKVSVSRDGKIELL